MHVLILVYACVSVSLLECFELYHATSGSIMGQKEELGDCYREHCSLDLIALMSCNWYDQIDSYY